MYNRLEALKRPKTVVSHCLENSPKHPKNKSVEGCSESIAILKLKQFFKPCVLCDYKEKEKTDLKLGATPNSTQFYFEVELK